MDFNAIDIVARARSAKALRRTANMPFSYKGNVATAAALPASGELGDLWVATDTGIQYAWGEVDGVEQWNEVALPKAKIITSSGNVTVKGLAVPRLTAEEVTTAFNAIMTGQPVMIVATEGDAAFFIKQADTDGDSLFLELVFYDDMVVTYELDVNDNVNVTGENITFDITDVVVMED